MHTIDKEVKEQLWRKIEDEFAFAVNAFVHKGVLKEKGETQKEALARVLRLVIHDAYAAGLDVGYDMGAHVFGGDK